MTIPSLQYRVTRFDNARYQGGTRRSPVLGIIWHATAGDTVKGARGWLDRLDDNGMLLPGSKRASYHYLIDKNGDISRTVHPAIIAYHAGLSNWKGLPQKSGSLNHCTIGISFANDNGSDANPTDDELTTAQLESGLWLAYTLSVQHDIPSKYHLQHREVAPTRKQDVAPHILNPDKWRYQIDRAIRYREWPTKIVALI